MKGIKGMRDIVSEKLKFFNQEKSYNIVSHTIKKDHQK